MQVIVGLQGVWTFIPALLLLLWKYCCLCWLVNSWNGSRLEIYRSLAGAGMEFGVFLPGQMEVSEFSTFSSLSAFFMV